MSDSGRIPFQSVLIYGMGMMGASLSIALRSSGAFRGSVAGVVRSEKSRDYILSKSLCDTVYRVTDPAEIESAIPLENFDCIVFSLPVRTFIDVLLAFPKFDGVITDMSSTRLAVAEAAAKRDDLIFVGSHPMCGAEDAGPSAAKENLYRGKLCILTGSSGKRATQAAEDAVDSFWRGIGMEIFRMDPRSHDETFAYLSHTPHFLSGLIASWAASATQVEKQAGLSPVPLSGGGFRDMVRIAGSNPSMWIDILKTNRRPILDSLGAFRSQLDRLIALLDEGDEAGIERWLVAARDHRDRLCGTDGSKGKR